MAKKRGAVKTKKKIKNVPLGIAHIHSTFNNTIIAISDMEGRVIAWKSGGTSGFRNTKKGTPFAAQIAAEEVAKAAMEHGMKKVEVRVKGHGSGKEATVRSLQAAGLEVSKIVDATPVPHNGCRPPKKRRV